MTIAVGTKRYPAVLAHVKIQSEVGTWNAKTGTVVEAELGEDITLPDKTLVPRKSLVRGEVDKVAKWGHGADMAAVALRFTEVVLKDGTRIPIVARLVAATSAYQPGSTSAGMPGHGTYTPNRGTYERRYTVMPNVGPGAIISTRGDVDIYEYSVLTLLVTHSGPPKAAKPEDAAASPVKP